MFGAYPQLSSIGGVLGLPSLAWEVSLGLWLILKGFKSSSVIISGIGTSAPAVA